MKIHSVEIRNFMSIGSASITLADRGLCLIQGENLDDSSADSNGAGKSSVAEAICWALYGATARGEDTDAVVNTKAGKDCRVCVTIEDDGKLYAVARHRKHKTGKNAVHLHSVDGPTSTYDADLTLGTDKLTQERIEKLIGCSYEVFAGSIYAGQEKMPDLPAMTDKNLKALIEEASGSTILEAAYAEARTHLTAVKTGYTSAVAAVERLQEKVEDAKKASLDFLERDRDWKDKRAEEIRQAKAALATEVAAIKKDRATIDEDALARMRDQIAAIDARLAAVVDEQVKLRDYDKAIAEMTAKIVHLKGAQKLIHNEIVQIDRAHFAAHDRLGEPCSECARPLTETEIGPLKTALQARREKYVEQNAATIDALEAAQVSLEKLTETRDAFAASMTDVSHEASQRAAIASGIAALEAKQRDIATRVESAKRTKEMLERLVAEKSPFEALIDQAGEAHDRHIKDLKVAEAAVAANAELVEDAEAVVKVFGPAGVRARILDEVTPFLNDQTAKYLGVLSDGNITATWSTLVKTAKGDLKEKFSIEVEAAGGKTFKAISGGERRKVRVATALALQDLVARRATKPIDLFIGDEIDDALDDAGLERLMTILEEKAKERGSVFVISHRSLRDWISNVIKVVKKDGQATVVEEVA